jgi:hypothetical protein
VRRTLLCVVAALVSGIGLIGVSGCISSPALTHGNHWSEVVTAYAPLSRAHYSLTFHVSGSEVRAVAEFSDNVEPNPVFHCTLQATDAQGNPVGRVLPLRLFPPTGLRSTFQVFECQTTASLKPGPYQLTYWGAGYCTLLVSAR